MTPLVKNLPSIFVLGKAALTAELKKINKNEAACALAGYGFQFFAIDVFGVVAPSSFSLLTRLPLNMQQYQSGKPFSYSFTIV